MEHLLRLKDIEDLVVGLLNPPVHYKRALAIARGVYGVMHSRKLSVTEVGRAMARARQMSPKHCVKQLDRLLSNEKFDVSECFKATVPWLVGERRQIIVTIDWTVYDSDKQTRCAVNLVTNHGRATPLVWKTFKAEDLKRRTASHECEVLEILRDALPEGVDVIVLADRGFSDVSLYRHIRDELAWHYVIRTKTDIWVDDGAETVQKAGDWIPELGLTRDLPGALVTKRRYPTRIVCTKQPRMKQGWILATNLDLEAGRIIKLYGKRFTCEENFRDEKDARFGFGLSETTVGDPERRDRLLFLAMLAMTILTLVGRAGEAVELDKQLRINTVTKRRTHSLLRQGIEYARGLFRSSWPQLRHAFKELLKRHQTQQASMGFI